MQTVGFVILMVCLFVAGGDYLGNAKRVGPPYDALSHLVLVCAALVPVLGFCLMWFGR